MNTMTVEGNSLLFVSRLIARWQHIFLRVSRVIARWQHLCLATLSSVKMAALMCSTIIRSLGIHDANMLQYAAASVYKIVTNLRFQNLKQLF